MEPYLKLVTLSVGNSDYRVTNAIRIRQPARFAVAGPAILESDTSTLLRLKPGAYYEIEATILYLLKSCRQG
jgi:hypothetical protein